MDLSGPGIHVKLKERKMARRKLSGKPQQKTRERERERERESL